MVMAVSQYSRYQVQYLSEEWEGGRERWRRRWMRAKPSFLTADFFFLLLHSTRRRQEGDTAHLPLPSRCAPSRRSFHK